jgi:hypothetical protein
MGLATQNIPAPIIVWVAAVVAAGLVVVGIAAWCLT